MVWFADAAAVPHDMRSKRDTGEEVSERRNDNKEVTKYSLQILDTMKEVAEKPVDLVKDAEKEVEKMTGMPAW